MMDTGASVAGTRVGLLAVALIAANLLAAPVQAFFGGPSECVLYLPLLLALCQLSPLVPLRYHLSLALRLSDLSFSLSLSLNWLPLAYSLAPTGSFSHALPPPLSLWFLLRMRRSYMC